MTPDTGSLFATNSLNTSLGLAVATVVRSATMDAGTPSPDNK